VLAGYFYDSHRTPHVRKQKDGDKYLIQVTHPGQPIPTGSRIEVVGLVPQGVSIGRFSPPQGWTCTPPCPIVGPDAFTCTFVVTTAIPLNGTLPGLVM